ncbi:K(+) efflux antiporter 5 isoform X2 [Physcomitrium patens]|uniref:Cation/H+ exchanger transmembrane domain-containing protein n=1 Tax=Physcomitrium patens TaxID=3218 RepID=A0A7I4DWW2_PHYPA|nr:K(+) efflux antiporter 5-like isoform X2 [Physcomitrium patens]|eukprot:XP_024378846.1 K(+) efflux antiporter 5-like isoform X2 [Physcomitrella patens]
MLSEGDLQDPRYMTGMMGNPGKKELRLQKRSLRVGVRALYVLALILVTELLAGVSAEREDYVDFVEERKKEAELNATRANGTAPSSRDQGSIAEAFDKLLEKEFPDKEDPQEASEGLVGSSFNNSVNNQQAELETVARVTHDKPKKNDTLEVNGTAKSFQLQDLISMESGESGVEETPRLIDKKDNVFVISNPRESSMVLQQDVRFISDLVIVIVSAAGGGILFACLGQPVITGYLLAGSAIGPGGLDLVSELVQVETVAQFGVVFLLFALGLEFSTTKLRVVRAVAIFGGFLQIALFMCLSAITAVFCGARASEGIFVGAFLSMSSTAVVLKFLMDRNTTNSLHGQVTIGTLILQDCCVGLLFALLPVLGGSGSVISGLMSMSRSLFVLAAFLLFAAILARTLVPQFLRLMVRLSRQTNELYQLTAVAFCLLIAWISDRLGLSLELGAFVAGVMISTTDLAEHTLEQVDPIRNLFASLFLASIGMLINVQFLWTHMDILLSSLILVISSKTIVITLVVRAFGYNNKNAFLVGMSLAQIGEFAFVLLSRASNLHLIQKKLYLLLLGTTALSLITTPLLFRAIPAVLHIGSLMHWLPQDTGQIEITEKRNGNPSKDILNSASLKVL